MIVLFPFISFLRSDQSLIFSIVDAGKIVGGVEAAKMKRKKIYFYPTCLLENKKKHIFRADDKNRKIKTIIGV